MMATVMATTTTTMLTAMTTITAIQMSGNVTPMCSPRLLGDGPALESPDDLLNYRLLHSHSYDPWQEWFSRSGVSNPVTDISRKYVTSVLAPAAEAFGVRVVYAGLELMVSWDEAVDRAESTLNSPRPAS